MHFTSRRSPVYAKNGMVASSQPLASAAGLRILQSGGNAADAAVAMAACLNVTEPCSTGIGGDCFVLFYDAKLRKVFSVQGNGKSPAALSLDVLSSKGFSGHVPPYHALNVTVPGAAAGWVDTIERYGSRRLTRREILDPAIQLAEEGFPVSPVTAHHWALGVDQLKSTANAGDMLLQGRAPKPGEVMKMPKLAHTFRALADQGKAGFYEGRVAEAIASMVQSCGGVLTTADLASHESSFSDPISSTYKGLRVWEVPPPTQGAAALVGLNILECIDNPYEMDLSDPALWHTRIESMKIAFSVTMRHVADPDVVHVPTTELVSKRFAQENSKRITNQALTQQQLGEITLSGSDTVYFCSVDGDGNACSMINSNYMGFGTGIIPDGCGFTLQNRGLNFSLSAGHPNVVAPNKRPYHTIIPGLATTTSDEISCSDDGDLYCTFGVMGGFMQPQGHLQVLSNLIDLEMNTQEALDAPRFCLFDAEDGGHLIHQGSHLRVGIECEPHSNVIEGLRAKGHDVVCVQGHERSLFGRGQIIRRNPCTGVLEAGSDPRADGLAIGW